MVGFVKVEIKVTEKDVFARTCTAVVEEEIKVRKEERIGEFVSRAGWGAIDAGEDEGLARECSSGLDKFEGSVGKGKQLRKGKVRRQTVLVDYGNTTSSGSTRGREQSVTMRSDTGNDRFITSWAEPRFCYHDNVKVIVCDEVRDHISFAIFADGL